MHVLILNATRFLSQDRKQITEFYPMRRLCKVQQKEAKAQSNNHNTRPF